MESTWLAAASAIGGVFGSLVTTTAGVVGVWLLWRKLSHRIKQESDASALSHFQAVIEHYRSEIERLTAQGERQDRQIEEAADGLRQARELYAECWMHGDELYSHMDRYYRAACEYARKSRRGDQSDEIPPPPPRPERPDSFEIRARTLEQSAKLVREIGRGGPDQTPKEPTT